MIRRRFLAHLAVVMAVLSIALGGAATATAGAADAHPSSSKRPQLADVNVAAGPNISVTWKGKDLPRGTRFEVSVQVSGDQTYTVAARARSVSIPFDDAWLVLRESPGVLFTVTARVTAIDSRGRAIATGVKVQPVVEVPQPREVSVTAKEMGYVVSWNKSQLNASLMALIVETDPATGERTVVAYESAGSGRAEIRSTTFSTRLVQVLLAGGGAGFSRLTPDQPLDVLPINPIGGDVTPPQPPCCLNWSGGPGSLTVQWNAADHPGARGLLISYGESLENMAVSRVTFGAGGLPEAFVIDELTPRTRYFVYVRAWDGAGNLSAPSPVREVWTS